MHLNKTILLLIILNYSLVINAAFSLNGNEITQTGTDNNLNGLSSISGVTRRQLSSGGHSFTTYNIGNRRLIVEGTLSIDPETEQLMFGESCPTPMLEVKNRLNIGKNSTRNSYTRQSHETAIIFSNTGASASNSNQASLRVNTGGRLVWRGGAIISPASVFFMENSEIEIISSDIILHGNRQIRNYTNNISINGLNKVGGDFITFNDINTINDYIPYHSNKCGIVVCGDNAGHGTASTITIENFEAYGNTADIGLLDRSKIEVKNSLIGSETKIGTLKALNNSRSEGYLQFTKDLMFKVIDKDKSPITEVIYSIPDYNNGNRKNQLSYNDIPDKIYSGTTDAYGKFATKIVTAIVNKTSAQNIEYDYRSKDGNNNDRFDIFLWHYDYEPKIVSDIEMKGKGVKEVTSTLFDDDYVIGSNKLVVATYTGINIDHTSKIIHITENHTLNEIYYYIKYNKTLAANVNYPSVDKMAATAVGSELDFGDYSFQIDARITMTDMFKTARTTGSVTFGAGGDLDFLFVYPGSYTNIFRIAGITTNDEITIKDNSDVVLKNFMGEGIFGYYDSDIGNKVKIFVDTPSGNNAMIYHTLNLGVDDEINMNIVSTSFTQRDRLILNTIADSLDKELKENTSLFMKIDSEINTLMRKVQRR